MFSIVLGQLCPDSHNGWLKEYDTCVDYTLYEALNMRKEQVTYKQEKC